MIYSENYARYVPTTVYTEFLFYVEINCFLLCGNSVTELGASHN